MNKKSIIFGIVLLSVGLFFGYLIGQSQSSYVSRQSSFERFASVASIMLDYGDGMVRVYPDIRIEGDTTILDITRDITEKEKLEFKTKDYGEMGMLVEQIGRKKNGDDGKYWQYWVSNVAIQMAADKYFAKAGDVIEWKFLKYK